MLLNVSVETLLSIIANAKTTFGRNDSALEPPASCPDAAFCEPPFSEHI